MSPVSVNPSTLKKIRLGLLAAVVLCALAEIFGAHGHGHYWWNNMGGFYSLFGLVVAFVLVGVAKGAAGLGLQEEEKKDD